MGDVITEKICTHPTHGELLPLDAFPKNRTKKDGYQSWCKACYKRYREQANHTEIIRKWRAENPKRSKRHQWTGLAKKYGLTLEEYEKLRDQPCSICGSQERVAIDHCHKTGRIRGPLCGKCNQGLGLFNDDPELFERATTYLKVNAGR